MRGIGLCPGGAVVASGWCGGGGKARHIYIFFRKWREGVPLATELANTIQPP